MIIATNTRKGAIVGGEVAAVPSIAYDELAERATALPLDSSALGPLATRAAAALLFQEGPANTTRSYHAALRYWAAWYYARYRGSIVPPVAVPVIRQFIRDHTLREFGGRATDLPPSVEQGLLSAGLKARAGAPALATLMHRISVLSHLHEIRGLPNPCREPAIRALLSQTRRAYSQRGICATGKTPLLRDPLERLLATCDDSLRGKRDRALLLFAWCSGGRRRSEVASATMERLTRDAQGYSYRLAVVQTGDERNIHSRCDKPIRGGAAEAMAVWLEASGIRTGAIFRRIRRGNRVAESLSAAAVCEIVKKRSALAGLEGDFSAHSLRSGFVTEASAQGASLTDIMAMTGHASATTVLRYHREGSTSLIPIAQLLSPRPAPETD